MNQSTSNRSLFTAAALLAALPLAARAQTAAPAAPATPAAPVTPATPTAGAAQPVTLRLKFTPGQTLYYTLTADTAGTLLTGQSGAGMPINTHAQMLMRQTVKDVRAADGAATIDTGIESMTITMNGQALPLPPEKLAQMKSVGTLVILPTGKTVSFTPNPALGGRAAMPGMDMSHAGAIGSLGQFPDAPVKPGDVWKTGVQMGMLGMQAAANLTLTGVDTSGGRTVAVIAQKTDGALNTASAGAAAPGSLKMTGRVSGTGTLRFDVGAGAVESQTGVADIAMNMTPPGATAPMKMQMKVTSTLARAQAPAAPVAPAPTVQ